MNREEHIKIGILVFVGYSILLYLIGETIPNGFFYGLLAVIIGSMAPDLLEPATNWKHRNKFHSKRTLNIFILIGAITTFMGFFSIFINTLTIFYISSGFFQGYLFHLLADSTTPMGLPD